MINIESITKGYGNNILFDVTSLQINHGEKVGFVGRNGHGKTTLLKMIIGEEEPDAGKIIMPNDYKTGYLSQKLKFSQKSVLEECSLGLLKHEKDHYWKAEKILAGLGFSQEDMNSSPSEFSGGYQIRLNLAKVLVSESDLLILDEPTNYLDITSIRWLINFLSSWSRELLLVTHDRSFMNKVVTHVAGVHRTKIRKVKGDTNKYYNKLIQDEEIYEKTRLNEEKREKEIQTFITRFRAKARLANLVQSRVKALNRSKSREKLQKIECLDFSFRNYPFRGKQVLNVENITFDYEKNAKSLIDDFSITIHPDDRIAIIGKNGKGKTTLLKLLAEKLKLNRGTIKYNPNVKMGYFEQTNINSLNDNFTVEQEIQSVSPDLERHSIRNICGAMMFDGDKALKKISVLSGGEKSRTMIGKLLVTPLNLLMLDEPDNHLDMETSDSFLIALDNFEGAVVLITHNEMFLNTLANRLIVFNNDRVYIFEGGYADFLEKEGWAEEENVVEMPNNNADKVSKKAMRQKSSQILAERSKKTKPIQTKIDMTENLISELENDINRLNNEIILATQESNGNKIGDLSVKIAGSQNKIDVLFKDLEEFFDQLEIKKVYFEEKLDQLER
ncbi:MAG: ABC-F family ATP-binding cassette domain-containing protein [Desulfobacteraceae bacterium]|nr:ABC-F family ATP-binding cassette domain-containing protein [Desulfobacteraceae bacterium]